MDRRRFLALGLGTAALAAAQPGFRRDPALAQPAPGPFGHGVASGDPWPDRVILWTRVTPSDDATPGSGVGVPTEVTWEIAEDRDFTQIVGSGTVTATAERDHTVKVDAAGLRSATEHWYRFTALGATSPVGRTRTAPAAGEAVDRLRFGVVSCSNYEAGYFSAYRHLAARDDLDLVLHLGDYIYEYARGGYATEGLDRFHDPEHEIVTLADYRQRHALYKTDPDLAALHRRYAFVTTIDDHELTNNAWADGAENHQDDEGSYAARKAAAMQAYLEWMPVRPVGDTLQIHRQLSFGPLADLFVLDERNHRSRQVEGASGDLFVTSPEVGDADRTMLGATQRGWFEDGLAASRATWKVVANSVMFAPLVLADPPDSPSPELDAALAPVFDGLGLEPPVVLNGDQWDGYQHEQSALGQAFAAAGGVVMLTGDIHSSWAAEIPADPGAYAGGLGESVAVEFVTPAVTSDSFRQTVEGLGIPGGEAFSAGLPLVAYTLGPWFKYLDPDRHGFAVFEVTRDAAQLDWLHISDRTDPEATVVPGPSWRSPVGTNRLEETTALGPRADRAPSDPSDPAAPSGAGPATGPGSGPPAVAAAGAERLPATGGPIPVGVAALAVTGALVSAQAARMRALAAAGPSPGGPAAPEATSTQQEA
jgi:alkaline phosphatase D